MNNSTKKELGCSFWGAVCFIALGAIATAVSSALGDPSEHSIKGQLAPLIAGAFFVIILLVTGILKIKR